jgi:hypothetical protein
MSDAARSASFRPPCDRFFFAFLFASMAASLRGVPSELVSNIFPDSHRIERRRDNNVFQDGRGRGNKSRTVTIEYLITRLRVSAREIPRSHLTRFSISVERSMRCLSIDTSVDAPEIAVLRAAILCKIAVNSTCARTRMCMHDRSIYRHPSAFIINLFILAGIGLEESRFYSLNHCSWQSRRTMTIRRKIFHLPSSSFCSVNPYFEFNPL